MICYTDLDDLSRELVGRTRIALMLQECQSCVLTTRRTPHMVAEPGFAPDYRPYESPLVLDLLP